MIREQEYYAGIGSRKTPSAVLTKMKIIAEILKAKSFILRSGGANGADKAFEWGSDKDSLTGINKKEIYIPWKGFNKYETIDGVINAEELDNYSEARRIAAEHHPRWNSLPEKSKKFHSRNVYQILGKELNKPSSFVVCWTEDGKASGGTGQAMRIAKSYGSTIYNLNSNYEPLWVYF